PPFPYFIPSAATDYAVGLDLSARAGLLFYAPDTTRLVSGARVEFRRRAWGAPSHRFYFGEYLHALDKTGGIGAIGYGGRGVDVLSSIGLAVPWGRSEGRRDVLIPDHTLALHGELRFGLHRELMIDRSWEISFEATVVGGLNLGKAAIRLGNKISDACSTTDKNCVRAPDGNPQWPLGHWMLQLGVSFGRRGGHPRYAQPEVFAPMGGAP
ncbi:MAG TPA: hypothetical protein VN253_20880, partial [Kofleriaceae bacterium]|nr:hypothetical protein [Kofleriaceae bacterium]